MSEKISILTPEYIEGFDFKVKQMAEIKKRIKRPTFWCVVTISMLFYLHQPTVHFAEEPIIRGGDEEDEDENEEDEDGEQSDDEARSAPFPAEKQRLIRKDTPHYKKHFKITKLPKPETVAALLEGFSPDASTPASRIPNDDEEEEDDDEEGASVKTPLLRRLEAAEQEDSRLTHPVKVRLIQSRKDSSF